MPCITVVFEYHSANAAEEAELRENIRLDIEDITQRYDNVEAQVHDENMLAYPSGALHDRRR